MLILHNLFSNIGLINLTWRTTSFDVARIKLAAHSALAHINLTQPIIKALFCVTDNYQW